MLPAESAHDHSVAGRIMALIPSGIEPATFRLVALFFNQLRHRVHPPFYSGSEYISGIQNFSCWPNIKSN